METIAEKKQKKRMASSITYTTGDIGYNIAQFNKRMGTDFPGNDNNNPSTVEAQEAAAKAANDAAAGESAGAGDGAGAGEGGAMGESLQEDKVFSAKAKLEIEMPEEFHLIPKEDAEAFIAALEPGEEFKVGYITPVYFYQDLLDKFSLVKITEMTGYTGLDYQDTSTEKGKTGYDTDTIEKSKRQIADPNGTTDYSYEVNGRKIELNNSNQYVKSENPAYRYRYGQINKTVMQNDQVARTIDANGAVVPGSKRIVKNLSTVLFYPATNSRAKVRYMLDMHDGVGYMDIDRDDMLTLLDKSFGHVRSMRAKLDRMIAADEATQNGTKLSTTADDNATIRPAVRALYTGQFYMLKSAKQTLGQSHINESLTEETKRYVKRYYIRPQNIFCSNKTEILQELVKMGDTNCSVYSLKALGDHDDVHLLQPKDIIYYYDDGILYDKNHVKVMDYDLSPKHEEERKKQDVKSATDSAIADNYEDRLVDQTVDDSVIKVSEELNPFELAFESYDACGRKLTEAAEDLCCICGEEIEGYGNNAAPYKAGRCCDACNIKFVIPARMDEQNRQD